MAGESNRYRSKSKIGTLLHSHGPQVLMRLVKDSVFPPKKTAKNSSTKKNSRKIITLPKSILKKRKKKEDNDGSSTVLSSSSLKDMFFQTSFLPWNKSNKSIVIIDEKKEAEAATRNLPNSSTRLAIVATSIGNTSIDTELLGSSETSQGSDEFSQGSDDSSQLGLQGSDESLQLGLHDFDESLQAELQDFRTSLHVGLQGFRESLQGHEESIQVSEESLQVSDECSQCPSLGEDTNEHDVVNRDVECNTEHEDISDDEENFEEAKVELHEETDVAVVDTEMSKDDITPILVLLIDPTNCLFEIVHIEFADTTRAIVTDIFDQIPLRAGNKKILKQMKYTGVCKQDGTEMKTNCLIHEYCSRRNDDDNNVFLAVPDGYDGNETSGLAAPILGSKKVDRMIRDFYAFHYDS